jgi:hypothetical protein
MSKAIKDSNERMADYQKPTKKRCVISGFRLTNVLDDKH